MKRGRMSQHEKQFISDNAKHMTYLDIAKELNRDPYSIRDYIENTLKLDINLREGAKAGSPNLRSRDFWPLIKQQFSNTECSYIESQWDQIYRQFQDDVTPTEEIQIIDTIKLDVMMQRNLSEGYNMRQDIEKLRAEIAQLEDSKEDRLVRQTLVNQIMAHTAALNNNTKEYQNLQTEKNKIIREMKATRQQRHEKVEASSESIRAWMAELVTDEEKRMQLGKQMEKIRLASIDEEIRLSAWHKYEDGKVDQPLLTPENVKEGHDGHAE